MVGLQNVQPHDAEYLAQRFGAVPYHRIRTAENKLLLSANDGAVGIAQGVRRLRLGQGRHSSHTYIFGSGDQSHVVAGIPHGYFHQTTNTAGTGRVSTTLEPTTGLACQMVLRAPSDGMLAEYAGSISRLLTLASKWLEWDPPRYHQLGGTTSSETGSISSARDEWRTVCPVVAGGGASEVSLHLLFRDLAGKCSSPGYTPTRYLSDRTQNNATQEGRCPPCGIHEQRPAALVYSKNAAKAVGGDTATMHQTSPDRRCAQTDSTMHSTSRVSTKDPEDPTRPQGEGTGNKMLSAAFSVLAVAMSALPDVLLENATCDHVAHSGGQSCQPNSRRVTRRHSVFELRHTLNQLHSDENRNSTGLVITTTGTSDDSSPEPPGAARVSSYHPSSSCDNWPPFLSFSCGLKAGVVQPLAMKYGTVLALLEAMAATLRVGGVVRCRRKLGRTFRGIGDGKSGNVRDDQESDDE